MKTRLITLVALAATWLPARAIDNLTTLLPEEVTMFMSNKDSFLIEKLEGHPLQKAIAGSALKGIFAPLLTSQAAAREKADKIYKEETGMTFAELQKVFTGGTAVGVKLDFAMLFMGIAAAPGGGAPEMPKGFFDITAAVGFSGDEALAEKIGRAYGRLFKDMAVQNASGVPLPFAKFPDEYDSSTDDYAGVKLHTWKLKKGAKSIIESPSYAIHDGALIFTFTEEGLHSAIDRIKKGGKSLADSPRHAALEKMVKDSDLVAYFDLASIIKSAMNMAAAQGGIEVGQILSVVRAIGLNKLDLLYGSADLSKGRSDFEFGLTFHGNPALFKVIAMDGPGIVPNFLPTDVYTGSYGTFHFDRALAAVESIMKEAVPAMGDMISTQLDEIKKEMGVDVRKDLLANIGPDIFSASQSLPDSASKNDDEAVEPTVVGIKLKDRKAVELAVNTIINKSAPDAAMIEKREFQGATIKNIKGMPIGFLFTDDWFVLSMGPQTLIEKVITRMGKGGDDHLFAQPQVKAAFEGLPPDDDGSTYFDMGPMLDSLLGMAGGLGELPGFDKLINLKDLPKQMNLPLAMGVREYLDDKSFRVRAHIIEKKK